MRCRGMTGWAVLVGLAMLMPALLLGGLRFYRSVQFDNGCSGRLKRAADANTVEIAKTELKAALEHLEANNLTRGYTSILYQTPDEDIGFWYKNLKASLEELEKVTEETPQVEKTNVLMKLRETLLDEGEKGETKVTIPRGISVYPSNTTYAFFTVLFGLLGIVGLLFVVSGLNLD